LENNKLLNKVLYLSIYKYIDVIAVYSLFFKFYLIITNKENKKFFTRIKDLFLKDILLENYVISEEPRRAPDFGL